MSLRVASWNMHAGVGIDGRFSPERIARVLDDLDADVIALQEFGSQRGFDMAAHLQASTGLRVHLAPTFMKRGSDFGNAMLTRLPTLSSRIHGLDVARREPRNAIEVVVETASGPLRVIGTHLGLRDGERRDQVAGLLERLDEEPGRPTILLGDFNEWRRSGGSLHTLEARFGRGAPMKTYPSPLPLLALDRAWVDPALHPHTLRVHRSALARIASDHLPLIVEIR